TRPIYGRSPGSIGPSYGRCRSSSGRLPRRFWRGPARRDELARNGRRRAHETGGDRPLRRCLLMVLFQGLLLLFFGYGLLIVVYQSLDKGWLPCGPNGFKGRLEFRIAEQPLRYWLMFAVYSAGGLWCLFTAFGILSGHL